MREDWFPFRGADVVAILEKVRLQVGPPATIRVDQASSSCRVTWTSGRTSAFWASKNFEAFIALRSS